MGKKKGANTKTGFHPIEVLYPRSLKFLYDSLHHLVEKRLWAKVLLGMVLGVLIGFLLGPNLNLVAPKTAFIISEWLALPGTIFLRVIQMIVIPLVFASIIRGIAASESVKQLKKTGIAVAIYFLITTTIAILIGVVLATWIQPGQYINIDAIQETLDAPAETPTGKTFAAPTIQNLPQLIPTLLPANFLGSMLNGEMLQIVIFALIFGIALININTKQSHPLLELLGSLQEVCMTIVKWTMLLAPIAVFGLMARVTSQFGFTTLAGIGVYVGTVLLGLVILLLLYTVIVYACTRMSPLAFLKSTRDAQLLAFSTSSSAAVMPLSMKTAEEKLKVRPSLSQFIIPIGATVNMGGTALYQAVATLFLAQVFGINLTTMAMIFLIVTIVGASIGAPSAPGVGISILAIILNGLGIPIIGLALILGVDRILDMSRTAINVSGDLTASVFINKIIPGEKTTTQLLKEEAKREVQRKKLHQDVIIAKKPTIKTA
jgi:Na+/H+-dicarboxylate symporter